jgi:uncharacterized protein (TIGR00730 family)
MSAPDAPRIAVFGSSEPLPGDALYEQSVEVGRLLAGRGYVVLTGGYGGVMEGASRGAADHGGLAEGVTCAIFDHREPNPYLGSRIPTADLHERTARLIDRASGYVILGGKAGTLAELTQLWALDRAGCLGRRPVILLGRQWVSLLPLLRDVDLLEPQQLNLSKIVTTPAEVLDALEASETLATRKHFPGNPE